MINKKQARLRRAEKTRARIRRAKIYRLSVHRTPRHIYAQLVDIDGGRTLAAASSLEKGIAAAVQKGDKTVYAAEVGKLIAERALAKKITEVAFDRSGFKYHGRVRKLAESAREAGLKF